MKFGLTALVIVSMALAQTPPPPGGSTSASYNATYKLDGGAASQSNQTYIATATDTSGVWVTDSGVLTLINPTIKTSGNTSSQDNSSFYGQNAALLATSAGVANLTSGSITTTGSGANGAFATGAGSSLNLTGVTINATGDGAHAVMATQGASVSLAGVTLSTAGASASAIATDQGGGTINVAGGNVTTSGMNSAGIYSTGAISVAGTTFKSTGAEAAVIEGANSITLAGVSLTSTFQKWGVMIYQSMSGDASGTHGVFTMAGGSLITKIRKAFSELQKLGWVEATATRFFGAQATGCSPITTAAKAGVAEITPQKPHTIAKSLAIGNPADGIYAVRGILESGGAGEDVTDEEIVEGMRLLAETQGIFTETAGGVTVAVARKLIRQGRLDPRESIVLAITGNGLKTLSALDGKFEESAAIRPKLAEFEERYAGVTTQT